MDAVIDQISVGLNQTLMLVGQNLYFCGLNGFAVHTEQKIKGVQKYCTQPELLYISNFGTLLDVAVVKNMFFVLTD